MTDTSGLNDEGGIRLATASDLPQIHSWLKDEMHNGCGFINNWEIIEDACNSGLMTVYVASGSPVGFIINGLSRGTILQTKTSCKRRGIGRALVEHAMRAEDAKNNAVLVIECEPRSSVEFWQMMGFEAHRGNRFECSDSEILMQFRSRKAHPNFHCSEPVMVTVCVYPEDALYSEGRFKPDRVHYVMGRFLAKSRSIELAHRVSIAFEGLLKDPVVDVSFEGFPVYKGKVKHDGSAAIGFKQTPNRAGWYLDVLKLPD